MYRASSRACAGVKAVPSEATTWSVWYMLFGFLWLVTFLIACNEFVVIVSAITWYFSDKTVPDDDGIPGDSDVSFGFKWSVRYHMGSLAFGSFILAVVWLIRIIFEYVGEKMIDATGNNGCTRCLIGCIRCCLDCFDRFIRYLNRNAFIYMALTGESFCSSALNAFILILKNAAKFAFVEGIADVFMFLAKFFISTSTTALSWLLMGVMTNIDSPYLPLFVIFMLSYLIAPVFIVIDLAAVLHFQHCLHLGLEQIDVTKWSLQIFLLDPAARAFIIVAVAAAEIARHVAKEVLFFCVERRARELLRFLKRGRARKIS